MNWLEIKNNADNSIDEIFIYGEIGDWYNDLDAKSLAEQIKNSTSDTIRVRINSGGGSVFTALSFYSLLKTSGKRIETYIDGVCASAATFIPCASHKVIMTVGGSFMIHNPMTGAQGDSRELRRVADYLDNVGGSVAMLYKERTGQDIDDITAKMNAETWMTAQEALDYGFVTELLETQQVAATAEVINAAIGRFNNLPKHFKNAVKSTKDTKEVVKIMDLAQFKAEHSAIAEQLKNEVTASHQTDIQDAVKAERDRISAIHNNALIGQEALAQEAITNGLSVGDFAIKALADQRTKGAQHMQGVHADTAILNSVPQAPVTTDPVMSAEDIALQNAFK